jgi:hypothetical protein
MMNFDVRRVWLVAALLIPLLAAQAFAETLYVKRATADLRSDGGRTSTVVATLNQGDAVDVIAPQGAYYQVRTAAGKTGFISKLHVSADKPRTGNRGGFGVQNTTGPSERSNISSIRGLNPVAEDYADAAAIPEQAVNDAKKAEDIAAAVTESDVDAFLAQGGVAAP